MSEHSVRPSGVSPRHPILGCAAEVAESLDKVETVEPVFMDTSEKAEALRELAVAETRVAALRLRVLGAADDVAEDAHHRDLGSWLRAETRTDPRAAGAEVRLARALSSCAYVDQGLRSGTVTTAQAAVITRVLAELPAHATGGDREKAEQHLVELAAIHTPTELRRLGRRILEIIDPDRYEHAEALALEREEHAAQQRVSCRFRDHGDGTAGVDLKLPLADAIRLKTYLEAYAQPRKQALAEHGTKVPYDRLLGQAFQHLLQHLDPTDLPHHGGDATTVMITMTIDDLLAELGTAQLGWDSDTITASEARRLACQAHLLPAVLGTHGEVLDLGRASRLHTPVQRKAIRLRDRHCRAEGCDVPGSWCDVHHLTPWSRGGKTSVKDGVLLCGHHHRQAHQPDTDLTRLPNGDLRYHRRE